MTEMPSHSPERRSPRRAQLAGGVAIVAALVLAGCQAAGPREGIGALSGAVAGGVIGSQIGQGSGNVLATVAGAAIGGFLGAEIGRSLDIEAQRRFNAAQYQALESGRPGAPITWQSPSGPSGQVVPSQPYQINALVCRDYTHTVYIDGRPEVLRGTACRQPDGTWTQV